MREWMLQLLADYGVGVVGALVFAMNAGLPVPGHTAYVLAVLLASQGRMSLPSLAAVAVPAAFFGGWLGFAIGLRGGHTLLVKYGPRISLTTARVAWMERSFTKYGGWAVILVRFVVVVRTFGHIYAGMTEFPPRRFLVFNAVGAVVWAGIYVLVGTLLGEGIQLLEDWSGVIGWILLGVAVVAVAGHFVWRRTRKKE